MANLSPKQEYQQLIDSGQAKPNAQQAMVVETLERIYHDLTQSQASALNRILKKQSRTPGLYLWGEVGIGKTFLIDLLYKTLPVPKLRQHFHVFMKEMHQQLFEIQGEKNPLKKIAKAIAAKCRILFLDEFIVSDICDAMVLAEFLDAMFEAGITLVTTSNTQPDNLYQYGFQREKFLPAITHIKENTTTIYLASKGDYRRAVGNTQKRYFTPGDSDQIKAAFTALNTTQDSMNASWQICGREVKVIQSTDDAAWFDFKTLCSPPRSQRDYIEISHRVSHVFLSGVPKLNPSRVNQVSLFTKLIDVLYDEGIKLTMAADVLVDDIYPAGELSKEFERTRSRIVEMTS